MSKFLLGLLCAGVLFWGYDRWFASEADAAGGDPHASLGGLKSAGAGDADGAASGEGVVGQEPLRGASQPALFEDLTLQEFVAKVDAGDERARDAAWDVVRRAAPEARAQLGNELLERIRRAPDAGAALLLLGRRNGFLHSEDGRAAVRAVVERFGEVEDAQRVSLGTSLLETCMRGSIHRDDREARALVDEIYADHQKAVRRHVFNPTNLTRAQRHEVRPGEALSRIARRYSKAGNPIAVGTLALVNRIHNINTIAAGQVLKIPLDPLHTVMEKGTFLMAVYLGPDLIRLYWVGHGADGYTPVTTFEVGDKLKDPAWYAPDGGVYPHGHPKNILGGYFIKFLHESFQGFGAHGTPLQETICTESSMGCIRMRDGDIAEFFELIPEGTKVEIRNTL